MYKVKEIILFGVLVISLASGSANNSGKSVIQLVQLANQHFDSLSTSEILLLTAVQNGEVADYRTGEPKLDEVEKFADWKEQKFLRSNVISWLCKDSDAQTLISNFGIRINGARFDGLLDLSYCSVTYPLMFINSVFTDNLILLNAELFLLYLSGSTIQSIYANGLIVKKNLAFNDGFKAIKEVWLLDAQVGAGINCQNGKFINKGGIAFAADRILVEGGVNLNDGFSAFGEIRFNGAIINGDMNCKNGSFINPLGMALNLSGITITKNLFINDGFYAEGSIVLTSGNVGGSINCGNAKLINKGGYTINGDQCNVGGSIQLHEGFNSEGELRLQFANVGGNLEAANCLLSNPGGFSLFAEGITVAKNIHLRDNFVSKGKVDISSAKIGNNLYCDGGKFLNENGVALSAVNITVGGGITMKNGFLAKGEVVLVGSYCQQFECQGSTFLNPGKKALNCYSMTVENAVALSDGFKAEGLVNMSNAVINGVFQWRNIDTNMLVKLNLDDATVGTIWDDKDSWPKKGNLTLQGFVYNNIHKKSPRTLNDRLEWIYRQGNSFLAQPYEQLAKVFKSMGYDKLTKQILYQKNIDRVERGDIKGIEKFIHKILGWTIGFGYKPERALIWILLIILLGTAVFKIGNNTQLIVPTGNPIIASHSITTKEKLPYNYPAFHAFIYSIDVFVPIIDLQMKRYWHPYSTAIGEINIGSNRKISIHGGYIRVWFIFQIIMGWVLTTLLFAGISKIIQI
ncbi:MAG: hypothetical protein HQ509_06240 [Candidatus Marinimicrobia bacterium]|nr:hypothetical protein [Candidatus Neomarinimicrobiota bacterium]